MVQLVDDQGDTLRVYDYDPYGIQLIANQNDGNPYRYCGEYHDAETGYVYLRARYYDPVTGRFISVDPAKDGWNWYAYCAGNPVLYVDPSGMFSVLRNTISHYDNSGPQRWAPLGNWNINDWNSRTPKISVSASFYTSNTSGPSVVYTGPTVNMSMTSGSYTHSTRASLGYVEVMGRGQVTQDMAPEIANMVLDGGVFAKLSLLNISLTNAKITEREPGCPA